MSPWKGVRAELILFARTTSPACACKYYKYPVTHIPCIAIGLVGIFTSGREWSHMRDFIYIKCCAKGFFSEISILDDKWLLKIAPDLIAVYTHLYTIVLYID